MTSLLRHITDLERTTELHRATVECYAYAVQTVAQYAVEVERTLPERHRTNLESVRHQILSAPDVDAIQETKSALRAELRDYRDRTERELNSLRQEFMSALVSLQEVMSSVVSSEGDHEKHLTAELQALQKLVDTADEKRLRAGVAVAIRNITAQVNLMRCQMELTIAQFKDEVRVLQRRLRDVETSNAVDHQTGALNRKEFESRVRRHVLKSGTASIAFIKAKNYLEVERGFGAYLAGEALSMMYKRLRVAVGDNADSSRLSCLEPTYACRMGAHIGLTCIQPS